MKLATWAADRLGATLAHMADTPRPLGGYFSVYLRQQGGGLVGPASDIHDFVQRVGLESPGSILATSDPYADTELCGEDLLAFRSEWQAAEVLVTSHLERKTWDEVNAMISRCLAEGACLVLFGD